MRTFLAAVPIALCFDAFCAPCAALETRSPNAPDQRPAFEGQARVYHTPLLFIGVGRWLHRRTHPDEPARWIIDWTTPRDRARITSFASRDGHYRLNACDVCERYLTAYDARRASRPVMPPVDSVATLPLDAAAMQRGYK